VLIPQRFAHLPADKQLQAAEPALMSNSKSA
jgi:hypothetical protein